MAKHFNWLACALALVVIIGLLWAWDSTLLLGLAVAAVLSVFGSVLLERTEKKCDPVDQGGCAEFPYCRRCSHDLGGGRGCGSEHMCQVEVAFARINARKEGKQLVCERCGKAVPMYWGTGAEIS